MIRKLPIAFAIALLGGLAAATAVFAQESASPPPRPPQTQGEAGDHTGMMTMMGQMSPDHMQQMARMVANCNRMMEGTGHAPTGPGKDGAPN